MAKAIRCAEEVFQTYAHDSSRARALAASSDPADWSLHRATYVGSCTAAKSVHLRYRTAESFFRYCERDCGGFLKATEFQVAAWANAYARRGPLVKLPYRRYFGSRPSRANPYSPAPRSCRAIVARCCPMEWSVRCPRPLSRLMSKCFAASSTL